MENYKQLNVQENELFDGGIESLIFILKHYKDFEINIDLKDILTAGYQYSSFYSLERVALRCGLLSVVCEEINLEMIIEYKQPLIVNFSESVNKCHFVVCYVNEMSDEFIIIDHRRGNYKLPLVSFQASWFDQKCLAFTK